MTGKRKILIVLESRSTYGYTKSVIAEIKKRPDLELMTLVTGMHFVEELGRSVDLIKKDGVEITAVAETGAPGENPASWSTALGKGVVTAAEALENLQPDIVVLVGDRVETFSVALAATYMGITTAHIQAGDKSGHVDDTVRMALGKLVHIHLASCEDAAQRLEKMGEQPFRIHMVGAPQLDGMLPEKFSDPLVEIEGQQHDLSAEPYILFVQHPLMLDQDQAGAEFRDALRACLDTGLKVFSVYPNSDLGFRKIVKELEELAGHDKLVVAKNLERETFLTLMNHCTVMAGNSSSGILEAPTFGTPVVNIGDRQRGRPQACNIINAEMSPEAISKALDKALTDESFRARAKEAVNPYGDGHSGKRIVDLLGEIALDRNMKDKQTVY